MNSDAASRLENPRALPPRLRRSVELVYAIEGVVAARIWHWPGRVAVGVRISDRVSSEDTIQRVEQAVAGIREPGELWDFGILADAGETHSAPSEIR